MVLRSSEHWGGRQSRIDCGFGAACGWLAVLALCAIGASWLPLDPNSFDPRHGLEPPSWRYPFGTTRLGENIFAICVHGTRVAALVAVGSVVVAVLIGLPLGLAAGYLGGGIDRFLGVLFDSAAAVPGLVVTSVLVLYLGPSLVVVIGLIGLFSAPVFARIVRSTTQAVVEQPYVRAARLTGATHGRVLRKEIGPNIAPPLSALLFLLAAVAILAEGLLSYLGLGVRADNASWGRLIQSGRENLLDAWWWSMCPSIVFFLTILSLNLVHDRLQNEWLDIGRPRKLRRTPKTKWTSLGRWEGTSGVFGAGKRKNRQDELRTPPRTGSLDGVTATDAQQAAVRVDDVSVWLDTPFGPARAVDGVSFSVAAGELLALVGESGAGKTMLARAILGIAPSSATTSGEIRLFGHLLSRSGSMRRGRDIGIVFQDPTTSLNPVRRIGVQVSEPARVHLGLSRRRAQRHAVELLGLVGLTEPQRVARKYVHELSGGQLQRAAIALALSCGPKVLIADEPTCALDVVVQRQIIDLLDHLRRDRALAIVLITHDLALATSRADRVAVMYAGSIVEAGSALALAHHRAMHYTAGLFAAAPQLAGPSHQRLAAMPGRSPLLIETATGCAFVRRCPVATEKCAVDRPPLVPVAEAQDGTRLVACWLPRRPDASLGGDGSVYVAAGA